MTTAIDILNSSHTGTATASDPLDGILNIGRSIRGLANHSIEPALATSSKMTHIDEQHCPKCHEPMTPAYIGQEEVFFCQKHAVTLPRTE